MAGLKLFLYRARNRIFSRRVWVVLRRPLESNTKTVSPNGIELREAKGSDIQAIAGALPDELAGRLSFEQRVAMVSGRFRAGVPCILAVSRASGQVLGGCWCSKLTPANLVWPLLPDRGEVFEISTLFVDPDCRGKNLGSVLIDYACCMMRGRNYSACVSLVWYTRQASVKAHLKVDLKPVGEKVTLSVLGYRRSYVRSDFQRDRLLQDEDAGSSWRWRSMLES